MSEYWVATPKRYCDACKCYISDDKTVIQVHEQGKRHKENVAKRLAATAKKGAKDHAERTAYEKQMDAIEKAAIDALKKDSSSLGEEDRKHIARIAEQEKEKSANAMLQPTSGFESTVRKSSVPVNPYEHIKTPDETRGIAGGWVTVSVKNVPPPLKKYETEEHEDHLEPANIPLPPKKKTKFGTKVVTLGVCESSTDVKESDVKTAFSAFKRKSNRSNLRQRTDD